MELVPKQPEPELVPWQQVQEMVKEQVEVQMMAEEQVEVQMKVDDPTRIHWWMKAE